jgi:hypothetical protein
LFQDIPDRVSQDIADSVAGVASGSGGWQGFAAGMSKARLVITAVTVEKRPVSEVARSVGLRTMEREGRAWVGRG